MPTGESQFLHKLEAEVEVELVIVQSSHPEEELGVSPAEWLFDPTDVEREEVGLRNLLGAVEAWSRTRSPTLAGARPERTQRRSPGNDVVRRSQRTATYTRHKGATRWSLVLKLPRRQRRWWKRTRIWPQLNT